MLEHVDPSELIDQRYRVIRDLGTGATGHVLLAEDLETQNSLVALKLLYPHLVQSDEAFARFRTETRLTMRLSHRNILTVYGFGRDLEQRCYLKMEYLEGDSLESLLAGTEPIEFDTWIGMLVEIASALQYAHAHGVIHRDLKPANILVTKSGSIRVLDFGLAQIVRSDIRLTNQGAIVGTPYYMAPEQFRGEQLDNRADLYAFGVIVFELLTGLKPFAAETLWELAEQHLHSQVPDIRSLNPACPEWLAHLVQKLLQKDRADRPKSMQEVLNVFAEAGFSDTDLPVESSPEQSELSRSSDWYRLSRRIGKGVRIALGLALLTFTLVLPRTNGAAGTLYAKWCFSIERKLQFEVPLVRFAFGVEQGVRWPDALINFGAIAHPRTRLAFARAGYSLEIRDPVSQSNPLHVAMFDGSPQLVEQYARSHSILNQRDYLGRTPLYLATFNSQIRYVKILLAQGADPDIGDRRGITPLHLAVRRQDNELTKLLLETGADPNRADSHQETPLHLAALLANAELYTALISAGGNSDLENLSDQTPHDIAIAAGIPLSNR